MKLKRLKGEKRIVALFEQKGVKTLQSEKLLIVRYFSFEGTAGDMGRLYAGISVSKRKFSKAVDRNRIKRQIRAALKENTNESKTSKCNIHSMWVYKSHLFPEYETLKKECAQILSRIEMDPPN